MPYHDYNEMVGSIKNKKALLRIKKGTFSKIISNLPELSFLVEISFLFRCIFPMIGAAIYCLLMQQRGNIFISLFWIPIGLICGSNYLICMLFSAIGIFLITIQAPIFIIMLTLPGILAVLGHQLWFHFILLITTKQILRDQCFFEILYRERVIMVETVNEVYQYNQNDNYQ